MADNDGTIMIEDARIAFPNFAGVEDQYNRAGDRNFCVLIDDDLAKVLFDDGWNVKQLKVRDEGDTPQKYLQVSIKYRGRDGNTVRPPTIVMITSKGRTALTEEEVEILDYQDIKKIDMIIRPYRWNFGGKNGVKAYLKSFYITIAEDALALRYQNVPEVGSGEAMALTTGKDDGEEIWDAEMVDDSPLELER